MSFNEYLLRLLWEGFCAEIRNMILYLPQTEDKEKKKALQQLKNTSVFQVRILSSSRAAFPREQLGTRDSLPTDTISRCSKRDVLLQTQRIQEM